MIIPVEMIKYNQNCPSIQNHNRTCHSSLLEAAGAIRLRISLMIHKGRALIATRTASFQTNPTDITNERSRRERFESELGSDERGACSVHLPKYSGKKAILIT